MMMKIDEFENYIGTVICQTTAVVSISDWQQKISLGIRPVNLVESVSYKNAAGEIIVLASDKYTFFPYDTGSGPRLMFKMADFPALEAENDFPIEILLNVGYTAEKMPSDIKKAALLAFSSAETFREDMSVKLGRLVNQLLQPYKMY
jgi:hypothetical protein